jgi:hypothetical protein
LFNPDLLEAQLTPGYYLSALRAWIPFIIGFATETICGGYRVNFPPSQRRFGETSKTAKRLPFAVFEVFVVQLSQPG